MSDQAQSDEIRKFFDDYTRDWYASDWTAVAMLYHVPSITMRGDGSVHCFQSREELEEFFQGVGDAYNREGNLGPGRYHGLTVQPMGARSVIATLTWQMVLVDGSLIREWRQSYNFVRVEGRWQILVATLHLE
jgi:hypothetical protein